ncbi:hypothetical protein F511_21293 [Dorcoceras hygrometricum]|uniref:Uncharacterized protein n=1 Tax=Dorcoceras hygrometricum TaxID=472368 RepID=A0A2Z7ARD7_9LAMI|nr:hypothetical protein F511_21293 [Dorcoceras hygrometricum]
MLRPVGQSRVEVNAGQRSCACDWLCWYVATGTRRGKRCALFCVLRLDDQQLVLRIEHPMRRRLDKLVRRRFEDRSMVCFVIDFSIRSTGCPAFGLEPVVGGVLRRRFMCSGLCVEGFDQPLVLASAGSRWTPLEKLYHPTPFLEAVVGWRESTKLLFVFVRFEVAGRAAIPHSHLPAGIVATMRRVVNYHSSWARQQQVELLYASGNPGSTAGRGFNPVGGAPGGG